MAIDAFSRLRVSNPFTIFDYQPGSISSDSGSNYDAGIWKSGKTGSGNVTYNSTNNYINLQISTDGDYTYRTSKAPIDYQPGKSRLVMMTGVLLDRITNLSANKLKARMGCN